MFTVWVRIPLALPIIIIIIIIKMNQLQIFRIKFSSITDIENMPVVYFLKDENYVKIGTTNDLPSRLMNYKSSNARDMTLIGLCKGNQILEKQIHSLFSELRTSKKEWFNYDNLIDSYLGEYKLNIPISSFNKLFLKKSKKTKSHQVNVKLTEDEANNIQKINLSFYENSFSESALARILILKGINSFLSDK